MFVDRAKSLIISRGNIDGNKHLCQRSKPFITPSITKGLLIIHKVSNSKNSIFFKIFFIKSPRVCYNLIKKEPI